jgi:hypothetical protein
MFIYVILGRTASRWLVGNDQLRCRSAGEDGCEDPWKGEQHPEDANIDGR